MGAFFVRWVNFTDFCLKSTILHHFLHFEKGFSYSFPSLLSTFSLPLFFTGFLAPNVSFDISNKNSTFARKIQS